MTININTHIDEVLLNALKEDLGNGDVTTSSLIRIEDVSEAILIAKGDLVLAGVPFAERVFQLVDSSLKFITLKREGSGVRAGSVIARIKGKTRSLLIAERTALNILQRMSGIATLTCNYVKAVKGFKVKIADTRKTAPGLRFFDKYAVSAGGGHNHRYGLYDGVLIKDNHIAAVGGIDKAVRLARSGVHHLLKVEVEVGNISEVNEALKAGADSIMLDNMSSENMKKAVNVIRTHDPDVIIEASGNITLENIREIAGTGVDIISVGALTHSAHAADLSLEFKPA
ncbi:MAG: carboxylating nicotinate-nucleotide diphosphorylase [Nitrospirae bacterium]|nr:carboxylating nicotinate-nucleotide diphosphorylase [Nitrospirota bacterium]